MDSFFTILALGVPLLLAMVPTLLLSKYFVKHTPQSIGLRLPILALQIISYTILCQISLPPGIWALGLGILLIYVFYGVVTLAVGLLLYPPLYLFLYKPSNSKKILIVYAVLTGLIFIPIAFTSLTHYIDNRTINTLLYGKLIDLNGVPVKGASVTLTRCKHYKENPVITAQDGTFKAEANCINSIGIASIKNLTDDKECTSRFNPFFNIKPYSMPKDTHLTSSSSDPFVFQCPWEKADFLIRKKGHLYATHKNTTIYINPYTGTTSSTNDGNHNNSLKIDVHFEGPIGQKPTAWNYDISVLNGGLIEAKNGTTTNVAPKLGYKKHHKVFFKDLDSYWGAKKTYYFKTAGKYGFIVINIGTIYDIGLGLYAEYALNLTGSKNLTGARRDRKGIHSYTHDDAELRSLFTSNIDAQKLFKQGITQKAGEAIIKDLVPLMSKEHPKREEKRAIAFSLYNLGQMAEKSELIPQAIENYNISLKFHPTAIVRRKLDELPPNINENKGTTGQVFDL